MSRDVTAPFTGRLMTIIASAATNVKSWNLRKHARVALKYSTNVCLSLCSIGSSSFGDVCRHMMPFRFDKGAESTRNDGLRARPAINSGLPSTWVWYLWLYEPKLFLASAVMQLAWSSCTITAAYYFVNRMTSNTDQARGLELCFGYLGTIIAISVSFQLKSLWVARMGASIKNRLSANIAEYALLRGSTSASDKAAALVLASQDAHNICEGAKCIWQLPAAISEGVAIVALVIFESGSLVGGIAAGLLFAGFILLFYMSLKMTSLKHQLNAVQDKQVSVFYEVLANIRPFRFYGWDEYFLQSLDRLTAALTPIQNKITVLKALNVTLVVCFPPMCSLVVFLLRFYETGSFSSTLFQSTILSLLNTFRYPLLNLPASLRSMSSANNSYRRMLAYFEKDIITDMRTAASVPGAVEVENLPIGPTGCVLKQLRIVPGSLFIFQGPVKSYKSTIMSTLAGHYQIPATSSVRIGGTVSYAPQVSWMCQTSIRENIICSEPVDEKRYQEILHACALTPDLSVMPQRDQTPVAEKGLSLSGGQRQRVALARAVYRRADIYLLDSPISALDDATQEFIWINLIEGVLKDATVIVASSRAVPSCSTIMYLSVKGAEGEPVYVGGWTGRSIAGSIPHRYASRQASADNSTHLPSSSRHSVDCPTNQSSSGKKLEDHATQDVEKEVALFQDYMVSKLRASSSSLTDSIINSFKTVAESSDQSRRSVSAPTFLDSLEATRRESGSTSLRISRRVSYSSALDGDSSQHEVVVDKKGASDSVAVIFSKELPTSEKQKSPFVSWIKFCGLSNSFLAIFFFIYAIFPAPRLWFDQWSGFWASKTYSSDDQFNIKILAASFVAVVVLRAVPDFMAFHFAARSERNIRRAICKTVVNAPMTFFMTENLGPLIGVFSRDMAIIGDELMQDIHMGILYMIFNVGSTVFVCIRFPYFVIPSVIIFALLFFVQKAYSQRMFHIREEFQQAQDDLYRIVYDNLEGVQILRTARAEQWALDHLGEAFENNRIATVAVEKTNIWLAQRADSLAILLCFFMVFFVNQFEVPANARGLIIGNSLPILVLFTWSMKLIGNAQFLLNSVHRIQSYIDKVAPEVKKGDKLPLNFPKSGRISFEKVSLRYAPSLPLALDHVSFELPHASKVGVVGRTGSGKSTLLVALFRLIQPCGGTLLIDGQKVNDVAVDSLRRQLSIIPQDPAMFEGNLRLNLDPFEEYTDEQVREVIHQVGLSEFRDMHSTVRVSGEDWSLGEKQLVCLARVLLKRPRILCLDEATASLDQKTEALFQQVLETSFPDTTIVCIAHRIDTLTWCRNRIEMRQGKLHSISAVGANQTE
jgi:ATP-binding cassette subfamily C (CFTR/MRP) protein 2